mgnify:CR=1 FL=1
MSTSEFLQYQPGTDVALPPFSFSSSSFASLILPAMKVEPPVSG